MLSDEWNSDFPGFASTIFILTKKTKPITETVERDYYPWIFNYLFDTYRIQSGGWGQVVEETNIGKVCNIL